MTKKSYAKVNVFLKIAGKRDNYHLLVSRFCRVKSLYDIISFEAGEFEEFTLEGKFGCKTRSNTIYKAYLFLCEKSSDVKEYFKSYKVVVDKNIPEFAGLGGGSSNCATFILMVNEVCKLDLTIDDMVEMGVNIGADVPFFLYQYDSANVSGIGEKVEKFDEEILDIKTITPKVQCNTGKIFNQFRDKFYSEISDDEADKLFNMKSKDIFERFTIDEANDLYLSASGLYEELKIENMGFSEKYFFSGSGSSFFRLKIR